MAARKFKFVSPGVFLKEIDNSQLPKLPGGVGPVLIGRTKRGPSLKPVKVNSFQDFVRIFGETLPGNQGSDPWRDGNGLQAPAYAPYAAQAYLAADIQSPVTVVRLAGVAGDDATADAGNAQPGWSASGHDAHVSNGATGLFLFPNVSNDHTTGSLVAILYHETGSLQVGVKGAVELLSNTAISGSRAISGTSKMATNNGDYDATLLSLTNGSRLTKAASNTGFDLLLNISGATDTTWENGEEKRISFLPGTKTYIRDVLNTNPVKTNTRISRTVAGTLAHKYWLGETFEEEFQRVSASLPTSNRGLSLAALPLQTSMNDFKSSKHEASPGQTGWIFGQHHGERSSFVPENQQKLFRIISLHEGESPSRELIIRIENLRIPEEGAADPYGTFAVVVLKIGSTRLEEVERFDGCNLNPNSQNFVARKIGNQYFLWSSVEKRNKVYGSYPNVSDYIRVEMDQDVLEKGPDEASTVPFGFYGPVVPKDINQAFAGGGKTAAVNHASHFVKTTVRVESITSAKTLCLKFPDAPLIQSASLDSPVFGITPFKMTYPARKETAILNIFYRDKTKNLILPVLQKISSNYQNYSGKKRSENLDLSEKFFKEQNFQKFLSRKK